mmetsp:Transcript_36057/g.78808  ORF Transcript_36057/g.78808 Transcript_36057/m.78808 type:complete len:182 (-) Transcript_36057:100-645(-)
MKCRRLLPSAFCLALAIAAHSAGALRPVSEGSLEKDSEEAVQLSPASLLAVESALTLPRNASQEQVARLLTTLGEQKQLLEQQMAQLGKGRQEETPEQQEAKKRLRESMKPADRAMMEEKDKWQKEMSRKTRLGAMNVISKLNNALRLIKKGALEGDDEARSRLDHVLETMSGMSPQVPHQ